MTERQNDFSDIELKNKARTFDPNKDRAFDVYSVDTSFGRAKTSLDEKTDRLIGMVKELKGIDDRFKLDSSVISDEKIIDDKLGVLGFTKVVDKKPDLVGQVGLVDDNDKGKATAKESLWERVQRTIKESRPVRVISSAIMALVTYFQLGQGISAMAEEAAPVTPTVDNPTKIEVKVDSSETSVKDEMPQLPEDNSSESTTNTTEGQITAKGGVGDLLASANGTVTSGDVGVEVPNSNGGEVQYATNVTNENGEPVIVPLEGSGSSEVEKSQIDLIAERSVGYLSGAEGYTDEEIMKKLFVLPAEKTSDLGLIHINSIQGVFLGYTETLDGDKIVMFLGVKDRDLERMVVAVDIPIYVVGDKSTPIRFNLNQSPSLEWGGTRIGGAVKDIDFLKKKLDYIADREKYKGNVIVDLYTDKPTDDEVNEYSSYGVSSARYMEEMKKAYLLNRSLDSVVFRNAIKKLEFKNPKSKIRSFSGDVTENFVLSKIKDWNKDSKDITSLTLGLVYN